jgi:hypothetical protein
MRQKHRVYGTTEMHLSISPSLPNSMVTNDDIVKPADIDSDLSEV